MQAMPYLFHLSLCSVLKVQILQTVGVFNAEGPPVPIPNTEVKLSSAENTCLATDWEDRSMPTQIKIPEAVASGIFLCKGSDPEKSLLPADLPCCAVARRRIAALPGSLAMTFAAVGCGSGFQKNEKNSKAPADL